MKKKLTACLAFGMFFAGISGIAQADALVNTLTDSGYEDIDPGTVYSYYANSGVLVGTVQSGNLSDDVLAEYVSQTFGIGWEGFTWSAPEANSMTLYGYDGAENDYIGTTDSDGKIENEIENVDYLSGTWYSTPSSINFYAVKSGDYTALYYVDPASAIGSWSTYDIWYERVHNDPNYNGGSLGFSISHYMASTTSGAPVPEPATMLLFGTGLVSLAGARLRKKKK